MRKQECECLLPAMIHQGNAEVARRTRFGPEPISQAVDVKTTKQQPWSPLPESRSSGRNLILSFTSRKKHQ